MKNITDVPALLRDIVNQNINNPIRSDTRILHASTNNSKFFYICFTVGAERPFSIYKWEGSHDTYIVRTIQMFLDSIICGNTNLFKGNIKFDFNYSNAQTFLVDVSVKRICNADMFFYFPPEMYFLQKAENTVMSLFLLIAGKNENGISLSEIIKKTQHIEADARKNMLENLITQNKIRLELKGTAKKKRKMYYVV